MVRLEFSQQLYGRESELKQLLQAVDTCRQERAPAQCMLLYGASGSGKTSLWDETVKKQDRRRQQQQKDQKALQEQQQGSSTFFISGKFDQCPPDSNGVLQVPYSGITQAAQALAKTVSSECSDDHADNDDDCDSTSIATVLRESLAYEGRMLTKLVSGFQDFLGDTTTALQETEGDDKAAAAAELSFKTVRLAVAMSSFFERFCSKDRLVVLFMDDLQWADTHSVELLQHLMRSPNLSNLLLIAAVRIEEDNSNSTRVLETFLDLPTTTPLPLDNLNLQQINLWISDLLGFADSQETLELAKVCQKKTLGNPYFVAQYLKLLETQGKLTFDFKTVKWQWTHDLIFESDVADNVVGVLTNRIRTTLPPSVRRLLQLMACVGYVIDMELLKGLDEMEQRHNMLLEQEQQHNEAVEAAGAGSDALPTYDFKSSWKLAEDEGMVELSDTGLTCKFSHDRVQQCAYEMVPKGRTRQLLHLRIGKYIRDKYCMNGNELNPLYIFRAADQLNRGSALIVNDSERFDLIRLNLRASQLAKTQSGMDQVANLLQNAIALHDLTEDHFKWREDYRLILELYTFSAEVEFATGKFDVAQARIDKINHRARDAVDTIRARTVSAQMAGVQMNMQGAILDAISMLDFLGAKLPTPTTFNIIKQMSKTKRLLRNKSDTELLTLPHMTNDRMRTILYILYLTSIYGFNADFKLAILTYLRMMQLTIKHGTCEWSPYAFAVYGLLLTSRGEYKEAFRMSQLAKQLQHDNACFPAYCLMANTFLAHLKQPMSVCLEPTLRAYRLGLENGDVMSGGLTLSVYAVMYLFVGLPLAPLTVDLKRFCAQIRLFQLDLPLAYILPISQLALNLSGQTKDPLTLTWDSIKQCHPDCYRDNVSAGYPHRPPDVILAYCQILNAYLLKDTESLEQSVQHVLSLKEKRLPGETAVFNYIATFVDGLAGFELYKNRPKQKKIYRQLAIKAIKWLVFSAKKECVNCVGMLHLLEAEKRAWSFPPCSTEKARKQYDEAISQLSRSGFTNFCAIANELAGEFASSRGDSFWAEHYLSNSMGLYEEWGVQVKVEQLRSSQRGGLLKLPKNRLISASFRGVQRFDDTTSGGCSSNSSSKTKISDRATAISSDEITRLDESVEMTAVCARVQEAN